METNIACKCERERVRGIIKSVEERQTEKNAAKQTDTKLTAPPAVHSGLDCSQCDATKKSDTNTHPEDQRTQDFLF